MKTRAVAVGIAVGLVSSMTVLTLSRESAQARPAKVAAEMMSAVPSPEISRIASVGAKDAARARKEMLALYRQDGLRSGADYRAAAETLEGSKDRSDLMMAHDLALAGLALGDPGAKLIVARTEDLLFKSVGLGERYGTLKGGNLPLTNAHRQLMTTTAPRPVAMAVAVPV
jgi:hypothetical protein